MLWHIILFKGGKMLKKHDTETQQIIKKLFDEERLLKKCKRRQLKRHLMRLPELSALLLVNELKPVLRKLSAIAKTIRDSK
ncbi:MAG: hypothetical protein V1661_01050 [bacterium]